MSNQNNDIKQYIENHKKIQENILKFIDNDENIEENYQNLIKIFNVLKSSLIFGISFSS